MQEKTKLEAALDELLSGKGTEKIVRPIKAGKRCRATLVGRGGRYVEIAMEL